jgi:hypothetical protein
VSGWERWAREEGSKIEHGGMVEEPSTSLTAIASHLGVIARLLGVIADEIERGNDLREGK